LKSDIKETAFLGCLFVFNLQLTLKLLNFSYFKEKKLPMPTDNSIKIEKVSKVIQSQLQNALPGHQAYMQMMPEGRELFAPSDSKPRKSAVLILLYQFNDSIYFPLIRRPKYEGAHSGQMALPGGKYEEEDGSLVQTALRESCEEIGVCTSNVKVIGSLTELYIPITNMTVLPVVGYAMSPPSFSPNLDEVDQMHFVKLRSITNDNLKKRETWQLHGRSVEIPYYFLDQQVVWGATALILSEFEAVVRKGFSR
jgi:8-oxo-dGTP pyrophosphatase MutT (NUDIX family)